MFRKLSQSSTTIMPKERTPKQHVYNIMYQLDICTSPCNINNEIIIHNVAIFYST